MFDPYQPHNGLSPLPPKAELETKAVLRAAIAAHRALAELRHAARQLPNQGMLVRALALQEARRSSEIEQIVTTNDELYRDLMSDSDADPVTKQVLRYGNALWRGVGRLKQRNVIDPELLSVLAPDMLGQAISIRTGPGTRVGNPRTGEVAYTPPEGKGLIESLLSNLCEYLGVEEGPDALVRLAVAHYQFEAIHPFFDGNGRVGRVLNLLFLVQQGLLDLPILFMSRTILEDRAAYYSGLRRVTEEGAWEEWILYVLGVLLRSATVTKNVIEAILHEAELVREVAEKRMTKGFSPSLVELIFEQPYTRISFLERAGIAKRQTGSEYLQELERIGLLRSERRGREVYYVNDALLALLG